MQLHEVQSRTRRKKHRQIGRGGRRGKTSGKGHKGQKARSGHRIRPAMRDIIKKLPKKRGYKFKSLQAKPLAVKLSVLDSKFKAGETVSPTTLLEKKIITVRQSLEDIKILDGGEISKKLTISGCAVSASVKAKIEKAGGLVENN